MFEPPDGPPEQLAERIRALLAPIDPAFVAAWKGVPEMLIDEYARWAGFGRLAELPPAYASYLRGLGAQDAYLLRPVGVLDTSLPRILDSRYRPSGPDDQEEDDAEGQLVPVCAIFFMVGGYLSFDRRQTTTLPLSIVDEENFALYAASWESLVIEAAVWRAAWRKCRRGITLSSNPHDLKTALGAATPDAARRALEEFGARHGLAVARSSGMRHHIMVGERRALWTRISLRNADAADALVYGFADDEAFMDAVESELGPSLGRGLTSGNPIEESSRWDLPK